MSRDKEATRRRILEATRQRLEQGAPTRLEDVAAAAGVTRQTIYLHFGSRAGLLLALVAHIDEEHGLQDQVRRIEAKPDPVERLEAALRLIATYQRQIHTVAMALAHHAATDPDSRAALDDRMEARRRLLRQLVEPLATAGRLHPDWTPDEIVDLLWEASAPTSYHHLVVERHWPPDRYQTWLITLARTLLP